MARAMSRARVGRRANAGSRGESGGHGTGGRALPARAHRSLDQGEVGVVTESTESLHRAPIISTRSANCQRRHSDGDISSTCKAQIRESISDDFVAISY